MASTLVSTPSTVATYSRDNILTLRMLTLPQPIHINNLNQTTDTSNSPGTTNKLFPEGHEDTPQRLTDRSKLTLRPSNHPLLLPRSPIRLSQPNLKTLRSGKMRSFSISKLTLISKSTISLLRSSQQTKPLLKASITPIMRRTRFRGMTKVRLL